MAVKFSDLMLAYDFASVGGEGHLATPLSVLLADGSVERPELGAGDPIDAFAQEILVAARAAASGVEATALSGKLALEALRQCCAEIESVQTGKAVQIR